MMLIFSKKFRGLIYHEKKLNQAGFESLYICRSDNSLAKKKDISSALAMISKLKSNKSFPANELKSWEIKFRKWLKKMDKGKLEVMIENTII